MATDPQLESYLSVLDKSLGQIPVSARAEIITEINSHVMEAKERDPKATTDSVLKALGEPETVANRYLMERGLKPIKTSRGGSIMKWLTIGFLGTFALICLTITVIIWRFTPLISVDEKTDRVVLLGGMIDVNGKEGKIRIGDKDYSDFGGDDRKTSKSSGHQTIDTSRFKTVQIPFANGKISLKTSIDSSVHWDCKFDGPHGSGQLMEKAGVMAFDFGNRANVKCEIQIPKKIKSEVEGSNGKIDLEQPQGDVEVRLTNGKVSMTPANGLRYHYDLRVKRGLVAVFSSSDDPKAIQIKMDIVNGAISNEASE